MIALDTETAPFGPGRMAPPLVCVSLSDGARGTVLHWTEAETPVAELLASGETIVGHNIAYDFAVLAAQFPALRRAIFDAYDAGRVEDTGIRAKLIDLAAGQLGYGSLDGKRVRFTYSLNELARRHLGVALDKGDDGWRKRYHELRDLPISQWPARAVAYAQDDAHATAHVWRVQEARLATGELADQHRQTRSDFWIQLMHAWGMTTSASAVAAFERGARANYSRLADLLVREGLKRPNKINRANEVTEGACNTKAATSRLVWAYQSRGLPVPMTEGGKDKDETKARPSLDDDACIKSGDPGLRVYGEFGKARKALKTDVPLVQDGGKGGGRWRPEPIHAHFEVLLETGDVGCSAPNLVNLPTRPGVRECFVPRPGFVFLACDYAAIQLRTWAQCCIWILGFSKMADVLNAGECPHTMVAADILGTPYAEVKKRPKTRGESGSIYFERQCGKVVNFGKPGGMGAERLVSSAANQYQVEISLEKARELEAIWYRWPEARPYLAHVSRLTAGGGRIQIKQFVSERLRGGLRYCDTANGFFSALAYDAIKAAGWEVAKACYVREGSPLFGSRIVNVIHDELLLEVPEELGHECAEELGRLMRETAQPWMPDVKVETEETLMRVWSKKAKAKRNGAGRLVAWEPERKAA